MNRLHFVVFTLHISHHKSYDFFRSISLAKDFFFMVGFSPCVSNCDSKIKLKSPTIISWVILFVSNSSYSTNMLMNTLICAFSVLALRNQDEFRIVDGDIEN